MIRDLFFNVPDADAATKLVELGKAEGWDVSTVFNYVEGVPFSEADDPLSVADPYVPDHTYSQVTLHAPDFDYDRIHAVHEKASELAGQVGGECVGDGCAIGEIDVEPIVDVIPFEEDAQPIVDYIVSQVGSLEGGMKDQAMEIRKLLVEAGWTPPPAVYLEGDDIPSHLPMIDHHGEVEDDYRDYFEGEVHTANYDVVHMNIDYDAAVARARERRGIPNPRAHLADEED
jgi:hypothetical protein